MRAYNFAAGPACLPEEVLKKAQGELLNYQSTGMSVMEMTHRSKLFIEIIESAEMSLRKLMGIPEDYEVLFLQGGASTQFAMVPLNLMRGRKIDFIHTGVWTKKAIAEAKRYGEVNVIASSEDQNFTYIPQPDASAFSDDADYVHIVSNNTIYGTRYRKLPATGDRLLVADMSSNILSEQGEMMDVSRYGLIFAGAQKNIGPAGLTIVIVRRDLVQQALPFTPTMLRYETHVQERSLFNTPPTYIIYMAKLVFEWLLSLGGVGEIHKINEEKAKILYDFLDDSKLFHATVQGECRSLMNVPFVTGNEDTDAQFIKEAAQNGLLNLKGHRIVGGMRASIYNAMPIEGVRALVRFMQQFEANSR